MDKNKVIQVATRYVQKGQYDRAIAEYGKILRDDPKDVRVLLKIGELQQKKGDTATAAKTLLQVAETYSGDGFFLKAVAVYKQVLKLDPALVEVHLQLAELYQQLGLMQDALAQYGLVAANHEKSGNLAAAIEATRRVVDLDPDNLAARVNLGELFAKENRGGDAVQEFRRAAEALKAQGRVDDYLRVAERIVFLDSRDLALARELANLYLARGDSKRALAKLQVCYGAEPKHVETLELLGRAFLELGQTGKATAVLKELARLHAEEFRPDDARAAWRKILRIAPDDAEARAALETSAPPVPAAAPASPRPPPPPAVPLARIALQPAGGPRPPAPPPAPRVPAPIPSMGVPPPNETPGEKIARLIAETDVYVKYGLRDKAFDHLRQILAIDPDSIEAHERASGLFSAGGNQAAAWAELANVCRICAERGLLERGRPHYERLREEAPHLPELAALGDAYVLSVSAGPVPAPEPSFALPVELETEVSHEIRLEPADAPEPLADPLVPQVRAPDGADDEAIAAAMVSAGAEQIDEDAAVVLPGEEAFAGPAAGDEFLPGAEEVVSPDDEWFFPGGSAGGAAGDGEGQGGPDAFGDAGPVVAGVLGPDGEEGPSALDAGPVTLEELDSLPPAPDLDAAPPPASTAGAGPDAARPPKGATRGDATPVPEQVAPGQAWPASAAFPGTSADPALDPKAIAESDPLREPDSPELALVALPDDDEALFGPADDGILELSDEAVLAVEGDEPDPNAPHLDRPVRPALDEPSRFAPEDTAPLDLHVSLDDDLADADADADADAEPEPEPDAGPDAGTADPADAAGPESSVESADPVPGHSLEALHLDPEELADMETELDEASFFLAQGLLAEAEDIVRSILFRAPAHPPALDLLAELEARREASASREPADGPVDLAAELASELEADAGGAAGARALDDFQYPIEDVFAAFKQGLSQTLSPEDTQTHYDLGIAYQEMGLLSDAIEQFSTALAGFRGALREVDCLSMIARCRSAQGEHEEAIARLEEALAHPAVGEETRHALLFELGASHEARGDEAAALACYAEVEGRDPGFRGVGRIVAALRHRTGGARKNPAG